MLHPLGISHRLLSRVERAFSCMFSVHATPARQLIHQEMAQQLAGHRDWLTLHPGLFRRLIALESALADLTGATAEQRRMLRLTLDQARAAGAGLDEDTQQLLRRINLELTAAETAYEQLQRHEAADRAVFFPGTEELAGCDEQELAAAEAAAREAGHQSGALLHLNLPVQQGPLERMTRRSSRRRLHQASVARGTLTDAPGPTTTQIGAQIAVLRARRARMLGFEHHLDSVLPSRTAQDRASIETMLRTIAAGALARLESEIQTLREAGLSDSGLIEDGPFDAAKSDGSAEFEPWDISFGIAALAEQKQTAAGVNILDQTEKTAQERDVPLEEALRQVFNAASQLYGVIVVERDDLPAFAPGARSFEVFEHSAEQHRGAGIGLFLLDLHARPSKSGGAWMNAFSVASSLTGSAPVVINALNVTVPAPGEQAALTPSAMRTLFHEFGHALHGLLAEAEFEELSGTAVPRDTVEFPSQVNEIFQELFDGGLGAAGQQPAEEELWGKGFSTVEHVAAVVLDLAWHTLSVEQAESAAADPDAFDGVALAAWGLDHPLVPPRYGTGFFKHIFAGTGYAAGYYSYLWAQVLAAEPSEWYREQLDHHQDRLQHDQARATAGSRVRSELLARGNTRDPLESYRNTFGRDPKAHALLRQLGL